MQLVNGMCAGVEQLANGNLQIDSSPAWAGSFEGSEIAPFFPIAQGYFEEEHVPVVSNSSLSGAEKLESDIYTTDDGGRHLHPWLAPVVTAAPVGGGKKGRRRKLVKGRSRCVKQHHRRARTPARR